jgi:hypothetical protein
LRLFGFSLAILSHPLKTGQGKLCTTCPQGVSFVISSCQRFLHPDFPQIYLILSGKDGDDAQDYQVKDVQNALKKAGKQ